MMMVNPADLRFTQDSIACHFKAPYEHFRIREALKMIKTGQMRPNDFPRLQVIFHEGCLWSMDNRRLWVFRKAKCSEIAVTMLTTMHQRLEELISLRPRFMKLSKANFFPRVRGSQSVPPTLTVAVHPRVGVAEVMSRHGFPERARASQKLLPTPTVASPSRAPSSYHQLEGAMSEFTRLSSRPGLLLLLPRQTESSNPFMHFRRCFGTQGWWSHLKQKTSARTRTPLLPISTHDDGRPTESWFGWARNLISGFFGIPSSA